jgi:A/G-specific adenine glycosylase
MLQQTQVKTVVPYYRGFLKALPTIAALARASDKTVLALWSGLGYYRRAENLKRAARKVMREHGGKIPEEFDALCCLPGVGRYTAGAIMSIAFNRPYPALDGNARRFLRRLFNVERECDLQEIGQGLVPASHPGRWNQALMELGATICSHRDPSCPRCPVREFCAARRSGNFQRERSPSARRETIRVEWPLAAIVKNGKILLRLRPPGGILAGLWELPGGARENGETAKAALLRHLDGLGRALRPGPCIGEIRHTITHHRIRAPLFAFRCPEENEIHLPDSRWRWFALSSLDRYPLSSLSLKAISLATAR